MDSRGIDSPLGGEAPRCSPASGFWLLLCRLDGPAGVAGEVDDHLTIRHLAVLAKPHVIVLRWDHFGPLIQVLEAAAVDEGIM